MSDDIGLKKVLRVLKILVNIWWKTLICIFIQFFKNNQNKGKKTSVSREQECRGYKMISSFMDSFSVSTQPKNLPSKHSSNKLIIFGN